MFKNALNIFVLFCLFIPGLHAQITSDSAANQIDTDFSKVAKWSFGVNGGYGYRLFRSGNRLHASNVKYIKDFKSGIAFGGEVSYFPWLKYGFGLKYDRYQSRATAENGLTEDVNIQFLGSSFTHRKLASKKQGAILTSLLLGFQPYYNKTTSGSESFRLSGNTMAWGISVAYEHRLSRKLALNLTGQALMGAVYRLTRDTGINKNVLHLSKDDSVDLSRASLTLGVRIL